MSTNPDVDWTPYDADEQPPAPIVNVEFAAATVPVLRQPGRMLLDTGADVSLIPASIVEQLGLSQNMAKTVRLAAFDGTESSRQSVDVTMWLGGLRFSGFFVVEDVLVGIVGRNILKNLKVTFDGPNARWQIVRSLT